MKYIKSILGIVLITIGATCLIMSFVSPAESMGATFIIFVFFGIAPLLFGIFLLKNKKEDYDISNYEEDTSEPEPEPESKVTPYRYFDFNVAGISFHEKEILRMLTEENEDWNMSKRDIIECCLTDERIYRYGGITTNVELVPEPDNPYDPNAVKVIADNIHIGYVPAKITGPVKKIIQNKDCVISCEFIGGEYKILTEEYDDMADKTIYKWEKDTQNIGAKVLIKYQ